VTPFRADTCFLWLDLWNNSVPRHDFPEIFSFAKNQNITLLKAKGALNVSDLFNLPMSELAFNQLLELANRLHALPNEDDDDIWTYIWGSPYFASMKAYKHLLGYRFVHPCFSWLWKSAAQKKHKVFFWLSLKDRLSTRNILRRKNRVLPSYDSVLCLMLVKRQ
jgi:hypothetical protein